MTKKMIYASCVVFFLSIFVSASEVTEQHFITAKKAFHDGFYEVAIKKLSPLIYDVNVISKWKQEGVLLLAFSAYYQKDLLLSENLLDRLILIRDLKIERFDILMLKLNILLDKHDYYLSEKTFWFIWNSPDISEKEKIIALSELFRRYFDQEQYQLAETFLKELMEGTKGEIEKSHLQLFLLECLLRQNKLKQAGKLLQSVDFLHYNDPEIHEKANLLTGRFLLGGKQYNSGMQQYSNLYQNRDISITARQEALFGLCLSYWNLGKYTEAKKMLAQYMEQFPMANNLGVAHLMLSQIYLKLEDFSAAERLLLDLTEFPVHDDTYYKSLYWLGEAYFRQKKYDEAMKVYRKLIDLKHIDVLNEIYGKAGMAWVYFDQNKNEEARKLFSELGSLEYEHDFVVDALLMEGNCLYLLNRFQEAKDIYTQFLNKHPLSSRIGEVLYKLGLCRIKLGMVNDALESWMVLIEKYPSCEFSPEALYRSGKILYDQGDYSLAKEKFEHFLELFSNDAYADYCRLEIGNCFYNLCLYREALIAYQTAIRSAVSLDIRHQATYYSGWCHYLLKEEDETLSIFQNFLKQFPSSDLAHQVLFWLGEYEYNRKHFQKASEHFTLLIERYSSSNLVDNTYFLAGKSFFQLMQYEKTISLLSLLIVGYPESDLIPDAFFLRGEAYYRLNRYEEAMDDFIVFETAYENSYLRKPAFHYLGQIFVSTKQYKNALIYFIKANQVHQAESAKDDPHLIFKQAECYLALGDSEQALLAGLKIIYDYPNHVLFHKAIDFCVEIYQEKSEFEKAITLLSKLSDEHKNVDKSEIRQRIRKLKYYQTHRKEKT